jgi:hypothetical protein
MVDDDLVAAIGAQGCLDGRRDGPAGVDVAQNSSIFRVVAILTREMVNSGLKSCYGPRWMLRQASLRDGGVGVQRGIFQNLKDVTKVNTHLL